MAMGEHGMGSLVDAVVVGAVTFVLSILGLLALYHPFEIGKPIPYYEWNSYTMLIFLVSVALAVVGAVYVYRYGRYQPPYTRERYG